MIDFGSLILLAVSIIVMVAIGFWCGMRMTLNALSNMEPDKFADVVRGLRAANEENPGMDKIREVLPKPNVRITLTAANNALLAHDADTGEFIAQGMDSQELILTALKRFPDKMFTIAIEDTDVRQDVSEVNA